MLSLKTIILKLILVCVFLVSPCCVHRDSGKFNSGTFIIPDKLRNYGSPESNLEGEKVVA